MLPDEVREAMEAMDLRFTSSNEIPVERASIRDHEWAAIKAHLLAREAEVERLTEDRDSQQRAAIAALARAERAEALLREALGQVLSNIGLMAMRNVTDGSIESAKEIHARITAHLSENSRG